MKVYVNQIYLTHWRALQGAIQAVGRASGAVDVVTLRDLRHMAIRADKWKLPTTGREDGAIFKAMTALAYALGAQTSRARRAVIYQAGLPIFELAGAMIAQAGPPLPPPPRYRADIEG